MTRQFDFRKGAKTVVFDCDSTLADIEGIDELAGDMRDEVQSLTDAAMEGRIPLEDVYGQRLEIIRPSSDRLAAIGRMYVERLVPDVREVFGGLLHLGKDVRIISGGLRPPVEFVARELGVPTDRVAAVGISFDSTGAYAGFEEASPLSRNGGKPEVVRAWRIPRPAIMVGDGMTDLEVRSEVDFFAAYMGVANRPAVADGADLVLADRSLAPVLALAAGEAGRAALAGTPWEETSERGREMLALAMEKR